MNDTNLPQVPTQFRDIPVELTISVGKARPLLRDLMELGQNSVIPLDKRLNDPVDIFAGSKLIARGTLEECANGDEGTLAVRLTEVFDGGAFG